MNRPLLVALALLSVSPLGAQTPVVGPAYSHALDRQGPVFVTASASFRQVEGATPFGADTVRLTQWSFPVTVTAALSPEVTVGVRTSYSSSQEDRRETVSGVSDTQVSVNYSIPVGAGHAALALGVNVPSGRTLSPEEVRTAFLVGQGFFGFRTPGAGSGLGVAPSAAWAVPISDRLAFGAGVSYQYRGSFEPRTDVANQFDPGDELLLTVGGDYRLRRTSTLSLDVSYVRYSADAWGDLRYEAGPAAAATAQWVERSGSHEVRLLAQARRRGDREVDPETEAVLGLDAAIPAESRALGSLLLRLGPRISVGATVQGRYYAASGAFPEITLMDVGFEPAIVLADGLTLSGRVGGTVGGHRGVEATVGLSSSL